VSSEVLSSHPVGTAPARHPRAAGGTGGDVVLDVRGLGVDIKTEHGLVSIVDDVNLTVRAGETVGLVGESGSGKTVTSLAIMHLLPPNARISGSITVNGREITSLPPKELTAVRGVEMAMIFQEPRRSLNPAFTVGDQVAESVRRHKGASRKEAWARAVDLFDLVGIPDPKRRSKAYPHEFSGGMCQRVMLAMALSCEPSLLIADEPTTALDVTVQAQILDLIRDLQREFNSAVIIITHDLGVVAELADDIQVMYAGRAIEYSTAEDIFDRPQHPYTWGLLGSMPRIDRERSDRLIPIKGTPPSLIHVPPGCPFNPRCNYAHLNGGLSETERPELLDIGNGHQVACHLTPELRKQSWETDIKPNL